MELLANALKSKYFILTPFWISTGKSLYVQTVQTGYFYINNIWLSLLNLTICSGDTIAFRLCLFDFDLKGHIQQILSLNGSLIGWQSFRDEVFTFDNKLNPRWALTQRFNLWLTQRSEQDISYLLALQSEHRPLGAVQSTGWMSASMQQTNKH